MAARQFAAICNMKVITWSTAVAEHAPSIPIGLAAALFDVALSGPTPLQSPAMNRRLDPKGVGSGSPPLQVRAAPT